jgi:hypothetical protein
MRHRIEHKHAFGPGELRNLGRAFEGAWHELRAQGFEAITLEQTEMTRTKLARWIIDYAAIGERDVARLKENGLMGLQWTAEFSVEGIPQFALGEKSNRGEEK